MLIEIMTGNTCATGIADRHHERDVREHHTTTTKPTTTTVKKTTTTKTPAQTREQARRTGGKVFNDDGTWHYGSTQTATATKK